MNILIWIYSVQDPNVIWFNLYFYFTFLQDTHALFCSLKHWLQNIFFMNVSQGKLQVDLKAYD